MRRVFLLLCCTLFAQGAQPNDPRIDFAQSQPRAMTDAPAPPPLSPSILALLAQMEAEVSAAKPGDTECALDLLAYQYALTLQPLRAPLPDVFYALQLEHCGATPPPGPTEGPLLLTPLTSAQVSAQCTAVFYVSPLGSDSASGSLGAPFKTIVKALAATRQARPTPTACVVLRAGTHYVLEGGTDGIQLTAADSGLIFTGYEGEEAWVSGGVPLPSLTWTPFNVSGGANIYVASIPPGLVASMPGLQTLSPLTRARRAQFPNFDFETDRAWIDSGRSTIQQWIKPPVYPPPTQYYIDLQAQGLKTDSTMDGYNRYGVGSGGPCGLWTGGIRSEKGWSYWCSNTSAGGGAGQDQSYTLNGYLGFPMGMVWEPTAPKLPAFSKWNSIPPPSFWGSLWDNLPTLSAYQNPGWFTSTFAITGIDAGAHTLNMTADNVYPAGGWQGGRNWWGTNMGQPDNNITSGPWFVENVFEELDAPGEYWFDPSSNKLYLFYNGTGSPPPDYTLVVSQLEVLFNISGTPQAPVEDVGFYGIAFRDQRKSLLAPWLVPSGGDWALRRAGGLHFEGTERGTVEGCAFIRMDANAIFAGAYNRNLTISNSEFSWLGMSGVVTHGYSEFEDGTAGEQPWGTQIFYNVFRELGLQEMQSSGWYTGKTPLSRLEGNLMFNGPRAMANFNDANAGGGSNITRNLVFNTCRQSGDHGPFNSWDRMPIKNRIASQGGDPSYSMLHTDVTHNYFIANYGGAQGFDMDDGSSWYNEYENVIRGAGFKMDYGGHDSLFHSNVVYVNNGWNCVNIASFKIGHADQVYDNDCVITSQERVDDLFENCNKPGPDQAMMHGYNNRFYTPNANASANCDCCGKIPLSQLRPGVEDNYTSSHIPTADVIVGWGKGKLGL